MPSSIVDWCGDNTCHCVRFNHVGAHERWSRNYPCSYHTCRTCYELPDVPYHRGYRAYNLVYFTRKNPCDRADCLVCRPGWSLTATELSNRHQQTYEILRIQRNYEAIEKRRADLRTLSETRARELLLSFLDDKQRSDYLRYDRFVITGSDGNDYMIYRGYSGNVKILETGRLKCAHPEMEITFNDPDLGDMYIELPDEDAMVAQVLMIMTDVERFMDTAYSA